MYWDTKPNPNGYFGETHKTWDTLHDVLSRLRLEFGMDGKKSHAEPWLEGRGRQERGAGLRARRQPAGSVAERDVEVAQHGAVAVGVPDPTGLDHRHRSTTIATPWPPPTAIAARP